MILLTYDPLDPAEITRQVQQDTNGPRSISRRRRLTPTRTTRPGR